MKGNRLSRTRANIFELQPLEQRRFLTMAGVSGGLLTVTGTASGETITLNRLSNGNVSVTGVAATFSNGSFTRIFVNAGGGNDTVFISGNVVYDDGEISGGNGDDMMTGGRGSDWIHGDGNFDTASYSARTANVIVDIDGSADDGEAGEGDRVDPTTEEVLGGAGNDTITGDGNYDFLSGGGGNDSIRAGAGGDDVLAGTGSDKIFGEEGDDGLFAKNNDTDTVNGGTGPGTTDLDLAELDAADLSSGTSSSLAQARLVQRAFALAEVDLNPGDLDTTYGGNDTGTNYNPDLQWDGVTAATVDSQGRVIIVGYEFHDNGNAELDADFVAARYNADGTIDTSFGGDGEASVDFTSPFSSGYGDDDFAYGVTVDDADNIIIVGSSTERNGAGGADFAICRLDATGALDTDFGHVRFDFIPANDSVPGELDDVARDVVVQDDGKIVVVGTYSVGTLDESFAVARLSATGSLDNSFGSDGMVIFNAGGASSAGSSVALQGDGDGGQLIVVGGTSLNNFLVARFTDSGGLDPSFGQSAGYTSIDINDGSTDVLNDIAVNADNEIAAVGQRYFPITITLVVEPTPSFSARGALVHFSSSGSALDIVESADSDVSFNAVAFDTNGNVVVAGSNGEDYILTQYTPEFALDTSFNDGELVVTDITPAPDNIDGDWIDAVLGIGIRDGQIIVGGFSNRNGDNDLITSVARYEGSDGVPPVSEVEGFLTYDQVQKLNSSNRSGLASFYLKSTHVDDEGRALIELTNANDVVKIYKIANDDGVEMVGVEYNNVVMYYGLETTAIVINGGNGDDNITATDDVAIPLILNGGNGNDVLRGGGASDILRGDNGNDSADGGAGSDVVLGGNGVDVLGGGVGNDILVGNNGADALSGGNDEDILVGGDTNHDDDNAALSSLAAEWSSFAPRATRIFHLRNANSGGLNGATVLTTATVHDDGTADAMTGGGGLDWFFRNAKNDSVLDAGLGDEFTSV